VEQSRRDTTWVANPGGNCLLKKNRVFSLNKELLLSFRR
jgi:hypothetical protein